MRTVKRDIVSAFIFSKDNKILLGKSIKGGAYQDLWIVPGGGIEPSETKIDALKREVLEEVGIDISDTSIEQVKGASTGRSEKLLRDTSETVMVIMDFYNYKILLPNIAHEVVTRCGDDFENARWFSANDLRNQELVETTRVVLEKLNFS